ncbi:helix-turn-helix domain-containing protein [Klebsiella pneumoniae]|nr:response regulator [Klebsiella pneumoniae]
MSFTKSIPLDLKIGEVLANIMDECGIARNKHTTHISQVLGITITHANRKMRGLASWESSQLEKLANSLNISISDIFKMVEDSYEKKYTGRYSFNKEEYDGTITFSRDLDRIYSAIKIDNQWHIFKTDDIEDDEIYDESRYALSSFTIASHARDKNRPRLALLDDDKAILTTTAELLRQGPYKIDTFTKNEDLIEKIKSRPYDGYILDWVVNDKSAYDVCKKIRESRKPHAMIIILTGQTGDIIDQEIAEAFNDFDILGFYNKPLRIATLQVNIDKYFRNRT